MLGVMGETQRKRPQAARWGRIAARVNGVFLLVACAPGAVRASAEFDASRAWTDLERMVAFGERYSGSEAIESLRQYLEAELRAVGLEPVRESFEETTPVGPIAFANVFVDLPGAAPDAPLVILTTHFDTKRLGPEFQGANDGGSGTAVLLELARVLAAESEPRPLAYRLLFLDGEEAVRSKWQDPDNRYGSRHHVIQLVESGEVQRVSACILIDMVGDAKLKLFQESYSDRELLELFFRAAEENGLGAHVRGPRQEILDDHLSFMMANIPSINLIDFQYGPRNAYWHTADDNLEHVSAESLGVTGKILLYGLDALERR